MPVDRFPPDLSRLVEVPQVVTLPPQCGYTDGDTKVYSKVARLNTQLDV